ncbi:MAG: lipocalin-like domain-containing protein [Anaerolineales bacterium]
MIRAVVASRRWWLLAVVILVGAGIFWALTRPPSAPGEPTLALAPATPESGFAYAEEIQRISLPADHGPHPAYQTEWWYYTGNLETVEGRHFGYQLTFFRRGLTPEPVERNADFAAQSIYFAHLALTDVEAGEHQNWERFSRGAAGLAGAQGDGFRVWLGPWSVDALDPDGSQVRVQASIDGVGLDLRLEAAKPLVLHGDRGLSPKSEQAGNASYYVSYTRMQTTGEVSVKGTTFVVTGESWFDHEWSTSALGPQAVGWDWFSLQLSDGRELMYFRIRDQDGSIEPVSSGTLVSADGTTTKIQREQVSIEVLAEWTSARSGASYPSRWRLRLPSADLDLTIDPWLSDQEMDVSFTYWEGAVRITGTAAGQSVTGNGFVELTGYAESMQGTF